MPDQVRHDGFVTFYETINFEFCILNLLKIANSKLRINPNSLKLNIFTTYNFELRTRNRSVSFFPLWRDRNKNCEVFFTIMYGAPSL